MLDKVPVVIIYDDGREVECESVLKASKLLGISCTTVSLLTKASKEGYRIKLKENK